MPLKDANTANAVPAAIEMRSAWEVQQDFALIATLKTEIVWDVIGPDQSDLLMKKLECMFPDIKKVYTSRKDLSRVKRENVKVNRLRKKLFHNIWQQRKYTNGALLHSIIYLMVTPERDIEKAKFSHNYTIHPIYRTRRCINSNYSAGCCMIFIDEHSRIYQNWNDFVNNNKLPVGTMIAPSKGCYTFNDDNMVELECVLTPATSNNKLAVVDNVVTVASLISQAAVLVSPFSLALTIATKTYETIRGYQITSDNVKHGVSTNLNKNMALTGNVISLTSSVVTLGAYMTVPAGKSLPLSARTPLQAINGAATLISCTKFIATTYDLYVRYFIDEDELDFSDVMAFGSSLLLLTNAVNNVMITSQIGKVGGNTLRSALQNKIKAGLTSLSQEVVKYAYHNAGNIDLLRLINDIPYKDVLCNIHTIYNNLTKTGFLTTLSAISVGALEILPGVTVNMDDKEITELNFAELTKYYGSKFVKHISNSQNLIDVLNGMGVYFSTTIVQFLLNQTRLFIETSAAVIDSQQNTFITTEMVLYKMFSYTLKNYKNHTYDFLDRKRDEMLMGVANYFLSLNPINDEDNVHSCNICGGYFYLQKN